MYIWVETRWSCSTDQQWVWLIVKLSFITSSHVAVRNLLCRNAQLTAIKNVLEVAEAYFVYTLIWKKTMACVAPLVVS